MADTFGVKLKSKDAPKDGVQQRPGCKRTEFKTKPVSDLKAMFDKSDGQNSSKAFAEVETSVGKTSVMDSKTKDPVKIGKPTSKSDNTHTKLTKSGSKSNDLSMEDKKDFEALAIKLKKTGVDLDALENKPAEPKVAVAKTYSGGKTYQATVGSKLKKVSDNDDSSEVNKNSAASILSFGLTKLRTRPGSVQKQEGVHSRGSSFDDDNNSGEKTPSSPISVSPRSNSPVTLNKDAKFIPGAAKGWKGKTTDSSSNIKSAPNFTGSSVGKLRTDSETPSNKIPGFRSVSPVLQRKNSSDDSSTASSASNLSLRGYKPIDNKTSNSTSAIKTDENRNLKKVNNKPDAKTVLKDKYAMKGKTDKEKEGVNDMKKMFETKTETSKVKTVEKVRNSPKGRGRGDFTWVDKGRISLEEFKQSQAEKNMGHRPLSRASSSGSNSSISRKDVSDLRGRAMRFDSPEPKSDSSQSSKDLAVKRSEFNVSRRMSNEKFLDIKQNFETKGKVVKTKSDSQSTEQTRKKLEMKPNKKILERKQSFEGGEVFKKKYEKSEVISPRDRGNVLATIKSLNELDAKAKAQPSIIRRTRSLPSDSLEDENDSSVDYYEDIEGLQGPYYQDLLGVKMGDDVSNEGDISSEADLLYEEIPANLSHQNKEMAGRKEFQTRRATAFKRRKKANEEQLKIDQASTEGDIDSDTDSSNSGIYEPIDHDGDFSESDSVDLPPELPPLRNQPQLKKKKKKEEKGSKGITEKFKKLYNKGKTKENSEVKGSSGNQTYANTQSNSVLSGIGDKLKNLGKTKNNSQPNLQVLVTNEEDAVCNSDSELDISQDKEISSKRSSLERQEAVTMDNQGQDAPPLPPRHSALHKVPSGGEMSRLSVNSDSNNVQRRASSSGDKPRSPRSPRPSLPVDGTEEAPPLAPPPRSRISGNIDLSMVIPVVPGGGNNYSNTEIRKSGPAVRDSYLHGQKMNKAPTSPEIPYIDASPETSPGLSPDVPPLPKRPLSSRSSTDSYVDVDGKPPPPVPTRPGQKKSLSGTDSYVDVGDEPQIESGYSLAEEIRKGPGNRKELEKRPVSSAYIKPYDLSTVPQPKHLAAPFQDVLRFRNEYEEDGLYIDLSDEQVYGHIGEKRYKSKLESEDLYQFYNTEKISRASKRKAIYSSFDESDEESYDGDDDRVYEDLSEYSSGRGSLEIDKKVEGENSKNKISTLEMFGKKGTVLRTLWAEMPEVKSSGVLDTITPHERKLQEAMFEIITSEATYLKSLNVLIDVFLMSEEFGQDMSNKSVLTRQERHVVFSNIGTIRDTSERFLSDLEAQWQKSVMLNDICDIIAKHASKYFECYVHYCSNQTFQDRHVTELRKKMDFSEALRRLEHHPECQGLPMISFLLLPMQRVTRLPLLVDAICHRLDPINDKARHKSAINAFNALSKVVKKCNDGAKKMQQTEQMCLIAKEIAFSATKEIPSIPLISASRYLVKQGEVTRIANEASSRIPFGKARPGKQNVQLFLFNDILLVTKKKGAQYIVTDYAQRNSLDVKIIDDPDKHARVLPMGVPSGCKYLFLLVILENYDKKQVESVFYCASASDRARWVDAFTPVKVTDDQRIYEEWDCPQVQCIKKYIATEPDELTLEESDVVNVFKKIDDGMYEGERIRDGERGWFPKDHTIEIVNSHVRARNLRMKYRIMAATEGYGS